MMPQKTNGHDNTFSNAYFDVDRYVTQDEFRPVVEKVNKIAENHARTETHLIELRAKMDESFLRSEKDIKRVEECLNKSTESIKDALKCIDKTTNNLVSDRKLVIFLFSVITALPIMHLTGIITLVKKIFLE